MIKIINLKFKNINFIYNFNIMLINFIKTKNLFEAEDDGGYERESNGGYSGGEDYS
jgi:hypothetical protein